MLNPSEKRFPIFFSVFLIELSYSWDISSSNGICAKIYTQEGYKGSSFLLKEDEQIPYLSDIQGWNETQEISFKVQEACNLFLTSEPFLKGIPHEFSSDIEAFEGGMNSAVCRCQKKCKCEEVTFRGRECARGYFNKDCTSCDALYTSFKAGGRNKLPLKFKDKVKSFIIRPGCSLKVTGEEAEQTMDLETELKADILPFQGSISSTLCACNETSMEQNSEKKQRKSSDPVLLNIPNRRGDINLQLKKPGLENHPGLKAALQSLRVDRSAKNSYILLLGLTGSGKSTAVNLLFDHPNITQVGSTQSTTTDIHEFRIPIQIDELGILNSELRIIDTPGIADTRGIIQDARFLATLDNFLSTHEDLKRYKPNVILIFVKFTDNRFYGESSSFVKMLKTIELFRDKIIDQKYSNIIFVLSHFASETKENQKDPSDKIAKFKKTIEEFSTLPKPIILVVAENKPEESELPGLNGYWLLPNEEFYPKNLFDQIQRSLTACGDPIGLSVIQTAFASSKQFEIFGRNHPLLAKTHSKVTKYLSNLSALERPPGKTEVSEILDKIWTQIDPELAKQYKSMLVHLKQVFSLKNIQDLNQIPQSSEQILKFFKDVQINKASMWVLEEGFNLTIPEYKGPYLVGSGYDLLKDEPLNSPIFDLAGGFIPNEIGFRIPGSIKAGLTNQIRNVISILEDRKNYIQTRMENLGLQGEGDNILLKNTATSGETKTRPGLNIVSSPDDPELKLSALIEYQSFQMRLDNNANLSQEYIKDLTELQEAFDATNLESVRVWNRFFQLYGTHVVVWASGGGSIEVEVRAKHGAGAISTDVVAGTADQVDEPADPIEPEEMEEDSPNTNPNQGSDRFTKLSETMSKILQYLADNFIGKETPVTIPPDVAYTIRMRGGNPNFYLTNVTSHTSSNGQPLEIYNILDKWQKSLHFEPEMLTSYLKLIPMDEILKNIGFKAAAIELKKATQTYLNASLIYVPTLRTDNTFLEDRDHTGASAMPFGDFESIQAFGEIFKAMAEESKRMQENFLTIIHQTRQENQRQNHIMDEQQRQQREQVAERRREEKENDRWKEEMQLKRDQIKAQDEREERVLTLQAEQNAAQLKNEQETQIAQLQAQQQQNLMTFILSENQRQHELHLAQINKKTWLDKTFDFVGGIFGNAQQSAQAALPLIAMSG